MALGGTNQMDSTEKVYYLKPKGFKKDDDITIEVKTRNEEGKIDYSKPCSWATGYLDDIEEGSFQHDGNTYQTLIVHLIDPDTDDLPSRYVISFTWGFAVRELLNRMAYMVEKVSGGAIQEKITIGVYHLKDKDRKGVFLKYGNSNDIKQQQKCESNWIWEKLKVRVKQVTINNKTQNDYTELDKFFRDVLVKMIQPNITPMKLSSDVSDVIPEDMTHPGNEILPPADDEITDDLPF